MRKFMLLLVSLLLAGAQMLQAQRTISGTVVSSEDNQGLPGVQVLAKGTTTGTTTNVQGQYSLNVPSDVTHLVFSFMGMATQEIEIGSQSTIDVVMSGGAISLDAVVVSGYGVQTKGTFTGSAAVVTNDKLLTPVTSFDKALQGNAPGVLSVSNSGQPGAGQKVVIRGIGTINGGTDPLYIIDGIPVASGNYGNMTQTSSISLSGDNFNVLSNLNPADIETMVVLKDAAATSIYGARASNGVVLITTKKGAEGKTNFNVKFSKGYSNRSSKHVKMLNKDQYISYLSDALVNGDYSDGATVNVAGKEVDEVLVDNFFRIRNANGDFYDYDWLSQAYVDNAPVTNFDISASGGTRNTKYFASASYLDQEGIVINTNLKRMTARLNLDHVVNKKIKFGINVMGSYNDQASPMSTGGYYINPIFASVLYSPLDAGTLLESDQLYDPEKGTLSSLKDYVGLNDGVNIDYLTSYANANFIGNARWDNFTSRTSRVIAGGYGQWDIIEGLIFKTQAGLDYFYITESDWKDPRPKGNSASFGNGYRASSVMEERIWNVTNTLNYIKGFGKHTITLLLGQEAQATDEKNTEAVGIGFAPGFHEISSSADPYAMYGFRSETAIASVFLNANYNWASKYFVSASARRDGSSRLSKDNRWTNFWSLGGSWKLSEENFAKQFTWLNNAMLRTSIGTSGNTSGIDEYAARGLYSSGTPYDGGAGIYYYQIENPDLTWEKNTNFNIGLDLSTLKGRLGGTIEFYNKKTTDLLLDKPISRTTGFLEITSNIGSMLNRGIELTITSIPYQSKNFIWRSDLNISHNKNKILKLVDGADIITSQFGPPNVLREGEDVTSIFTREWAGVNPANGRPMYYTLDGELTYDLSKCGEARKIIGNATPKFMGGWTNRFEFFGFDVSAMLYFVYGNKIYNASWLNATHLGYSATRNQYDVVDDRWRKEGDISAEPNAVYGYTGGVYGGYGMSKTVFDGSYIRLRDLTIGYTLPKTIVNKVNINHVRVFMQGSNLLTLTKFPDHDPEVGLRGYYYLGYPNAKTITFGIELKF